jgi:hypothetical protein
LPCFGGTTEDEDFLKHTQIRSLNFVPLPYPLPDATSAKTVKVERLAPPHRPLRGHLSPCPGERNRQSRTLFLLSPTKWGRGGREADGEGVLEAARRVAA